MSGETASCDETEKARLAALRRLQVMGTPPEVQFDALARAASRLCETPMSAITLIDQDRQWLKASIGLSGINETERSNSFCTYTIAGDSLLEVEDTTSDCRFSRNPFVVRKQGVRFYAGAPLKLSGGENVGSLCVFDTKPRRLSETQKETLIDLAEAASRALEAHRAALQGNRLVALAAQTQSMLKHSRDAILSVDLEDRITQWNLAAERLFGYSAEEATGASAGIIIGNETERDSRYSELERAANAPPVRATRIHRNGTKIPVLISIGPVVSEDGKIVGATEIIRDISDIISKEHELANAEARVRRLYEATPAMLYSVDLAGILLSASDRWLDVMGYHREDVVGRKLADFMTERSARLFHAETLPLLSSEGHFEEAEGQVITRDGAVLDVMISAVLERGDACELVRSIGIMENISERREVERALRSERTRLNQIIQTTHAGTWEWNVATGENRVNDMWAAMLGYTLAELEPVTIEAFEELVHPDDRERLNSRIEAHLNGKEPRFTAEVRMRHKAGHWLWIASSGQLVTTLEQGQPEWMYGTHQDITERRNKEEELRLSNEFLDRIGQVAGVGGWEVDLVNSALYWSDKTCQIHEVEPGFKPDLEVAIDFFAPTSQPVIQAAVEHAIATGEGYDLELQLVTAKGRLIWVRAVGTAEFEDGEAVRLTGSFQDISEAIKRRKEVEDINQRFAVASKNGRVGIWDADLLTGKTLYSDIWLSQIGYERNELSDDGLLWQNFIHPDDIERVREANEAHLRGDAPYFEEEFRFRHKDGRWIWILDRGLITERDSEGNAVRMIGTHIDITTQKEQDAERLLLGERMAIATDNGGIGIWEVDLDTQAARWDDWMYRLYGLPVDTPGSLVDLWHRYTYPEDAERVQQAVRKAIENDDLMEEEYRVIWPDGSTHHLHASARRVAGVDGMPDRFIGATWDVTEERQLALDLAEQHELMHVTLKSIGDAVITTDAHGNIRWLNPVAEKMTGWSLDRALGQPSHRVFKIVHEETRRPALDPLRTCLELGEVVGLPEDTLLISRNGIEYGIEDSCAPIRNGDGEVLGAVLVFHDVSEQRRLSREMSYRASHDQLTGLINRSEFDRRMDSAYEKVKNGDLGAALLFIDLDRFKIINDSCGHAVGDQLLVDISELMRSVIRANDTLARLGGDEFAAIIENCSDEMAITIAEKICKAVASYVLVHDEKHYRVGSSIGVSMIDHASASASTILQEADAACYAAKEGGRNRVHVWQQNDKAIEARLGQTSWVARIEQALEEDGFVLYVQKIVPFDGQRDDKTHVELLLRMLDENGGIIPPSAFLPASERFNLATRIDRWVLEHALQCMASARAGGSSVVSVNVSGQSVGDRSFHRFALELLHSTSDELRRSLCLEITETTVISNMAEAVEFIEAVRELGVMIALDDFGAGSASFNYLKNFSVDFLKIDGQFSQGLLNHPIDEASIRCFIDMARILGIQTVAEYVSDKKIADRLHAMGVDFAQGYFYHVPEPVANLKLC